MVKLRKHSMFSHILLVQMVTSTGRVTSEALIVISGAMGVYMLASLPLIWRMICLKQVPPTDCAHDAEETEDDG